MILSAVALRRVESEYSTIGNAEVALGEMAAAQQHFQQAAEDPGLESIAYANLALVSFESGDNEAAIRVARQLLRRCRQPPWQTCQAMPSTVRLCVEAAEPLIVHRVRMQGHVLSRHTLRFDR